MRYAASVAALVLTLFGAPSVAAMPAAAVVEAVRARAVAAQFDGEILMGEADGSHQILGVGSLAGKAAGRWRWASITKQLAAVLAMQEVAAGRLDLDAPVARYWPDWRAPHAATLRIRDLLRHNSGLPQPDESPADADGIPAFYRSAATGPSRSAAGFCAGTPRAAPPAKFEYNNCDSIVLAEVLQRVTGKPFDTLVRDRFARKLGMRSLGMFAFGSPPLDHVRPNGEFADIDGLIHLGANGASAGAYGTIGDLWRFDHALLTGKLLPRPARETMWKSSRDNGFYGMHQWIFPAKLAGCADELRIVERQGLVGGIELRNYLIPETNQAVILFSRHRPADYGDPWEGKGFAYDVLSAVVCRR